LLLHASRLVRGRPPLLRGDATFCACAAAAASWRSTGAFAASAAAASCEGTCACGSTQHDLPSLKQQVC
jgi:hypothetical protein